MRSKTLPSTTPVYGSYWYLASQRQNIFARRILRESPPWTEDAVLSKYRFTNAYRATDRVSQYLVRHVIYSGEQSTEELFFRILLFKLFNKIETWELIKSAVGEIVWSDYSFRTYEHVLGEAIDRQERIYSAAYIMPSGKSAFGHARKHENHLRLVELMMKERVADHIAAARTMKEAYEILLSYPTIGPFLAYQYVTDINYSEMTDFSEMDFVVAGPGARSGIRKCFGDNAPYSEEDLIRYVADRQEEEFEARGLKFQTLWGRRLQLIDCQNLFCEVDKYSRVAHPEYNAPGGRSKIKQKFKPNPEPIDYWFPPKWGLNDRISAHFVKVDEQEAVIT